MTPAERDLHPLATIFPRLEGPAFDELVEDIRANGLREPITLYEGKILDGRNRANACRALGTEAAAVEFEGGDPLAFVISKNLKRRHLKDSQRALIAARIANMPQGGRTDRGFHAGAMTHAKAAALLNVRERTLQWARSALRETVPEMVALVESGQLSVSAAGEIARAHLPPGEQLNLVEAGSSAIVARARLLDRLPGRQGRSEYAVLWVRLDAVHQALAEARLDKAQIATRELLREINRVAAERRSS